MSEHTETWTRSKLQKRPNVPPHPGTMSDHCFFANNSVSPTPTLLSFLMRLINIIMELSLLLNIESWAEYCSVYSPKSPRLSPNSIYVLSKTLSCGAPHHSSRCVFSLAATSQPFQLLQCAWWSLAGRHWCPQRQESTRREGHKATFTTISDSILLLPEVTLTYVHSACFCIRMWKWRTKFKYEKSLRDFPGGTVVKTLHFHSKEHRFNLWSGN